MVPDIHLFDGLSINPYDSYHSPPSTCPPITKLSPQLLQRILSMASEDDDLCAPAEYSAGCDEPTQNKTPPWRESSLESQGFWHNATDASVPQPFNIQIGLYAMQLALMHLPQMQHFHLTVSRQEEWLSTEQLLKQPAPFLESLSLTANPQELDRQKRRLYLKNIFGGYAPKLRQLEVRNCQFDISSRVFCNINDLVLENIPVMPMYELFDVLRNMKLLEKLRIVHATDSVILSRHYASALPMPDALVDMPNLKELTVDAPISVCASIITNIIMRDSCSIRLWCRNANNSRDLWEILSRLAQIASHWGYGDLLGQHELDIGLTQVKFVLQGPQDDGFTDDPRLKSHPVIELALLWTLHDSSDKLLPILLDRVLSAFKNSLSLETFVFSAKTVLPDSEAIQRILYKWSENLEDVQIIKILGHHAFTLYAPLLRPDKPLGSTKGGALFPEVHDLIFEDVNFTISKRHHWRSLVKILNSRKEFPILHLEFWRCIGDFDQNIPGRFGVTLCIDGEDVDDDEDGEDSDYTMRGASDSD